MIKKNIKQIVNKLVDVFCLAWVAAFSGTIWLQFIVVAAYVLKGNENIETGFSRALGGWLIIAVIECIKLQFKKEQ